MKIIIIDDNEANLYLLISLLQGQGHEVVSAHNGEEALLEIKKQPFDLIISDILMPVMDGFTLCRKVKTDPALCNIPFIIHTATYTGPQDEILALKIGADRFIVKPCEPDYFLQVIDEVMNTYKTHTVKNYHEQTSEEDILKLYNERLVRKLEQKMIQAEEEVQARRETEKKLLRSEEQLKTTQSIGKIGGWEWDLETQEMFATDEIYIIHDIDPVEALGNDRDYIEQSILCYSEKDRAKVRDAFTRCVQKGEPYEIECSFKSLKGRELYVRTAGKAVMEDDRVVKVYGYIQDITESKLAELEQEKLKEQFLQAQKLESIGQLAGGVAHDFNNILTIVLGYGEEILKSLKAEDPIFTPISEIVKAGKRALSLTRQLLTFSRKNIIQPQVLDLNTTINDLKKMLLRLIGEDIEFITNLSSQSAMILADISQIEQVILNLVINAREAMPYGGRLTIMTENIDLTPEAAEKHIDLKPGRYVSLTVSDTGIGMHKDVKARVFEPFFTTKENGKGTGLGLSTVYGIVKQAGGSITVQSELKEGTCFSILLPYTDEKSSTVIDLKEENEPHGNGEHILLVEDDASIRDLMQKIVIDLGYKITCSNSANQALQLIEEGLHPDMMITDIVMPGMNGYDLAKEVLNNKPSMKIIIISGYSETIVDKQGSFDQNLPFLQKPFTRKQLAIMMKQILTAQATKDKLHLLMIDDDPDFRTLFSRYCNKSGYVFSGVDSAEKAIELLSQSNYDAILVDMNIPGSDGLSTLKKLRAEGFSTPAIIISGIAQKLDPDVQSLLKIVSSEVKDTNMDGLLNKIKALI